MRGARSAVSWVVKILLALALTLTLACGAATPAASPASPTPREPSSPPASAATPDLCAELDASLPRFTVRATATGWARQSAEPIEGVEADTLEATEVRDAVAIATVGDGACGAYGECIRGAFAVCGEELVVLRAPDYVFELRFGEGRELVETQRLSGGADEMERMERGEPLTVVSRWRLTPRGYRRVEETPTRE